MFITIARSIGLRGASAVVLLASAGAAYAGGSITLTPASNIQATINSGNFSEIVLAPGTYNQTIVIDAADAPLTIRSENPSDAGSVASTILDGEFLGTSVILLTSGVGADVVIDGITIQNGEALGAAGPANRGGAIDCENASPTIRRCVLRDNHADSAGGAFYVNAGSLTIEDTAFIDNEAPFGAGAYCNNSTVNFVRCRFESNDATEGGACRLFSGTGTFTDCDLVGNTSITFGGGVATRSNAALSVTRCWFESNFSGDGGSNGRGGAIYHDGSDAASVENSVFWNNGVSNYGASLYTLQNIVLRNNTHNGEFSTLGAGDVFAVPSGGRIDMYNSMVWHYAAGGGAITGAGVKNATYCNIEGGYPGAGNIGGDSEHEPMFVDADNGDFRLLPGSAGIDAGDASKVLGEYPTDYDGMPRALDDPDAADTGLAMLGISVDMGAFEFQPEIVGGPNTCPADIVDSSTFQPPPDGVVNGADLAFLLGSWGACR